jgi:nucleotide-binding universal stress UspA family protein
VALRYLRRMANGDPKVQIAVQVGSVCDQLMSVVKNRGITDVVMASHGRTGLSRMILGSVADGLIHDLRCPVIVVPSLVGVAETEEQPAREMGREPVGV